MHFAMSEQAPDPDVNRHDMNRSNHVHPKPLSFGGRCPDQAEQHLICSLHEFSDFPEETIHPCLILLDMQNEQLTSLFEAFSQPRWKTDETGSLTVANNPVAHSHWPQQIRLSMIDSSNFNVFDRSHPDDDAPQQRVESDPSLLEGEKFLNAVLENLSDGIVACNEQGQLTLFNRATQEFYNLPPMPIPVEEWSNYYDLYRADGVTPMPTEEVPLYRALNGESIRDVEMTIVPKNGLPRTVLASGDPITSPDGRRLGAVVAMKDISRRKKAEAALQALNAELESRVAERTRELEKSYKELEREIETRKRAEQQLIEQNQLLVEQNQELERHRFQIQQQNIQLTEASLMKSRFLATISHELRTPMNAIIGFSQLLLRQRKTPLSPQMEEMVRRILNNGKKLLAMVNELLDSSKAEAGKLDIKPQPCNVNLVITTMADELRSLAIEKSLDFHLDLSLRNPYIVNDPVRVRQVMINLVSNAIKFTESGYVRVTVGEQEEGDRIIITVKDSGIGMDQETIKTIFEPFHQSDQSTTRRYEGTGLGLAIVKSLVTMMEGTITVISEPGSGSQFCIDIPRTMDAPTNVENTHSG